jgi:hypothetical protein
MKIRTEINQKKNVRVHTVSGQFDIDTLLKSVSEMYTRLPIHTDMNVLWDLRAAEGLASRTSSQLHKVIDVVGMNWGTNGRNKAALVISRNVDIVLSRVYEKQSGKYSPNEIRVFRDIEKAAQWIDLGIN